MAGSSHARIRGRPETGLTAPPPPPPPVFLVYLKSLPSEALTFGRKCSQNAVKQNLHEFQFFIAVEAGRSGGGGGLLRSRHNFFGPLLLVFLNLLLAGTGGVYAEPLSSRRLRFSCIALLRSVTNLWLALLVDERRLLRSEASCRTMIHVVCQPQ